VLETASASNCIVRLWEFNLTNLVVNNLGGLGPDTNATSEIRYKNAGITQDGTEFDLVVVVAAGSTYASQFNFRNGLSGQLGQINIDVEVTTANNGLEMTDFTFIVQDSATGVEMKLDDWEMGFLDLDVNKAENLHERLCINNDEFDLTSAFPINTDIKITNAATDCAGQASQSGSVTLESQGVGFLCDNPTSLSDLADVTCADCSQFSAAQCAKQSIAKFFPIKRSGRVGSIGLVERNDFTVSFGINCEKPLGESCNRNFLFSGFINGCEAGL